MTLSCPSVGVTEIPGVVKLLLQDVLRDQRPLRLCILENENVRASKKLTVASDGSIFVTSSCKLDPTAQPRAQRVAKTTTTSGSTLIRRFYSVATTSLQSRSKQKKWAALRKDISTSSTSVIWTQNEPFFSLQYRQNKKRLPSQQAIFIKTW